MSSTTTGISYMKKIDEKSEQTIKSDRLFITFESDSKSFTKIYDIFDMSFYKEIYIEIKGVPIEAHYNIETEEYGVSMRDKMIQDNCGFDKLCKYLLSFSKIEFTMVSRIDY